MALTVGCATLIIPPSLRIAADHRGIGDRYAVVAALLLAAAALTVLVDRVRGPKGAKRAGGKSSPLRSR
jgi:hypothetical protein